MNEQILTMLNELRPEFDFTDSNDYIEDGFLDSFDLTTLVAELEEKFDCLIDPMDIRAENFATVDTISALVEKSK